MIPESPLFMLEVAEPAIGLEGFVCVHSIGANGSSGGMRCLEDVSREEVSILARAMSFKYSYFGIKQGGAKAGLKLPTGATHDDRQLLIAGMARHLEPIIKRSDIWSMWTDMNFYGPDLQHFFNSIGMPWRFSGTSGSTVRTGISGAWSVEATAEGTGLDSKSTRIAIEGYGGVAQTLVRILNAKGFKFVAVSNHLGAVRNDQGLDIGEIEAARKKYSHEWVCSEGQWARIPKRDLFSTPCDILVPGARVHSIGSDMVGELDTRAIVPVANVPCADDVIRQLHRRGTIFVPDYVVNGGGVCGWIRSENDQFGEKFRDMIIRALALQDKTGTPVSVLCDDIAHRSFHDSIADAYLRKSVTRRLAERAKGLPGIHSFSEARESRLAVQKMCDRIDSLHR